MNTYTITNELRRGLLQAIKTSKIDLNTIQEACNIAGVEMYTKIEIVINYTPSNWNKEEAEKNNKEALQNEKNILNEYENENTRKVSREDKKEFLRLLFNGIFTIVDVELIRSYSTIPTQFRYVHKLYEKPTESDKKEALNCF